MGDHLTRQMDSYDLLYNHHALVVVAVYHYICGPLDSVFQLIHAPFMTPPLLSTSYIILQNILIDVY